MTFSEWLKTQGVDEAALDADQTGKGRDRLAQLRQFFVSHRDFTDAPAADMAGAALTPGDLVAITYRVTSVHDDGAGPVLKLSQVYPDGSERHAISCPAGQVQKV